jgi:tRNA uridine 5-carboxymethylaminomethyl modification enzyme
VEDGFDVEQPLSRLDIPSVETSVKYEGYLKRQESDIRRRGRDESRRIPRAFHYAAVPGLSNEVVQRLTQVHPETIGQAMRIPGMTPAAIAVLATYVSRHSNPPVAE